MKKNILYNTRYLLALLAFCLVWSCTDDADENMKQEGSLLRIAATFDSQTRLAELPNTSEMANDKGKGLKNIGVYIYYTDDYNKGNLKDPYIRNMEFTVNNGELIAASGSGTDQQIYIYAPMTIVAFYPYNADMSKEENYFSTKADEEKYPITKNVYADQFYIPYRAQTTTDPSLAYYTVLSFVPKHTYKVELVVVAKNASDLPSSNDAKILPANDPLTTPDPLIDGLREKWYDDIKTLNGDITGSYVQQYITYIWTKNGNENNIKQGDVLLETDKLTLIASQDLIPDEQRVYRYGYNISTGEIFIPTSSELINTAGALSGLDNSSGSAYQVCDIDMSSITWNPISLYNARYDGGGHKIENMTINSSSTQVGLFSQAQGNSTIANVNLVNPSITSSADNAYVGALVGRLNIPMTEAEKQELIGNLPVGLSPIVRQELIKEILANAGNSVANIVASKVQDPQITVTGINPIVGALVGQAGEKNDFGNSKSRIWDSAVLGGNITVNDGVPANNQEAFVGGFVGLNQGYIGRSYTTIDNITAQKVGVDGEGNPTNVDIYTGFTTMGTDFTPEDGAVIENNYSQRTDPNNGVSQFGEGSWPSWSTYTGDWPVETTGWMASPSASFWYSNGQSPDQYPLLQWERR